MPFFMIFVVVASVAIFWLFKVVATAGALIAAVPFSFVLLRFGSVSVHPPALEDADTYDAVETTKIVGKLLSLRHDLERRQKELYAAGDALGIPLRQKENGTRFDARTARGKELNKDLQRTEDQVDGVARLISSARAEVASTLPNYLSAFSAWARRRATLDAARVGGPAFALVAAVLVGAMFISPTFRNTLSGMVLWPGPSLYPLIALDFGGLAGLVIGLVCYLTRYRQLFRRLDPSQLDAWQRLFAKWCASADWERYFPILDYDVSAEPESTAAPEEQWHVVLGVLPHSTDDEIKQAFRGAAQQYHPDRVRTLGPKLQAVAEQEMQRLNAAYAAARLERGF